ncbi:MAG TPA: transposase [Xanthobacteraceae bacterium]
MLALFYPPDRSSKHPEQHLANYAGLMQADAYAGFSKLYHPSRKPGAIIEAAGWAHARRKFFDLARLQKAPIAIEAVKRIDALFAIEREINGKTSLERVRVRNEHSRSLVNDLETWLREQRRKLSSKSDTAKAINYSLHCRPPPTARRRTPRALRGAKSVVTTLRASPRAPLDDRISEPYGVREPGGISLSGCHPNRVQATSGLFNGKRGIDDPELQRELKQLPMHDPKRAALMAASNLACTRFG